LLPDARGQRPWIVYAPVQTDQTAAAVNELMGEFNRFLSTEPATPDELSKVVRSNSFSLPGQYETNNAVMSALLSNERFGRPDDYVSGLKGHYESTTLEGIQGTAETVLHPKQLTWVIVGDSAQIRDSLEELGLAPVEAMDADGEIVEP